MALPVCNHLCLSGDALVFFVRINHLELKHNAVSNFMFSEVLLNVESCSAGSCFASPEKLQQKTSTESRGGKKFCHVWSLRLQSLHKKVMEFKRLNSLSFSRWFGSTLNSSNPAQDNIHDVLWEERALRKEEMRYSEESNFQTNCWELLCYRNPVKMILKALA